MEDQEQFSEDSMPVEAAAESEFSYTRRVATAVLVLLAAGLLGYVLYFYVVMPTPTENEPVDTLPAIEDEALAEEERQRGLILEYVRQAPTDLTEEEERYIIQQNSDTDPGPSEQQIQLIEQYTNQ